MPTKFMGLLIVCTVALTLAGCIFSNKPVLDMSRGATDLPVGIFEMKSPTDRQRVNVERHGSLYLYAVDKEDKEKAILSFHPIGDAFYLAMAVVPGSQINYGVVDARSKELGFAYLQCTNMPDAYVPQPNVKGHQRCEATDAQRLFAIANRYKAEMLAGEIEPSNMFTYTRIP